MGKLLFSSPPLWPHCRCWPPMFEARASLDGRKFDYSLPEALAKGPVVVYFALSLRSGPPSSASPRSPRSYFGTSASNDPSSHRSIGSRSCATCAEPRSSSRLCATWTSSTSGARAVGLLRAVQREGRSRVRMIGPSDGVRRDPPAVATAYDFGVFGSNADIRGVTGNMLDARQLACCRSRNHKTKPAHLLSGCKANADAMELSHGPRHQQPPTTTRG